MSQVNVSRYGYTVSVNPDRHLFSSRCSKAQHGMCKGITKRGDGFCKCSCHKKGDSK